MLRLLLLLLGLGLQAQAQSLVLQGFRTPSGNIHCMIAIEGRRADLRCDLLSNQGKIPPRPAGCEFDYGNAFGMLPSGKATRLCVSDTVASPDYPVLAYGQSWKARGFSCVSQPSGLRCSNRDGHGWELSRSRQRLF